MTIKRDQEPFRVMFNLDSLPYNVARKNFCDYCPPRTAIILATAILLIVMFDTSVIIFSVMKQVFRSHMKEFIGVLQQECDVILDTSQ